MPICLLAALDDEVTPSEQTFAARRLVGTAPRHVAASALAEVVTGEPPEFGLVVLVKTDEGTVLLKDGERFRQPGLALREAA
jgi:hypothetical protein